jgi:hypothetical protein
MATNLEREKSTAATPVQRSISGAYRPAAPAIQKIKSASLPEPSPIGDLCDKQNAQKVAIIGGCHSWRIIHRDT